MPTARGLIGELAVMLAVAFGLAALGPFGSFEIGSFAARLAYWLPSAFAGYFMVRPTLILARLAGRKLQIHDGWALSAGVLVAALPMSGFILWLNGDLAAGAPDFEGWFQLYIQVVLIGGAVTFLFWLLERAERPAEPAAEPAHAPAAPMPAPAPPAEPPQPPLLARLPPHLREGLLALEMEDHYVRVHTRRGSTLLLLRMRDAVAELAGVEGMQVHRSWWVARDAVEKVTRSGRGVRLALEGGVEAPVARSSIPALRAAGWI